MLTILIVEDDSMISHMYRMKFESEGFAVEMASGGEHGVMLARTTKPAAILLDIEMPGIDGIEALRRIRQDSNLAKTPVIVLTNLDESEAPHEKLAELGVTEYIVKVKMTPREVVARVKTVLGIKAN